MNRFFSILALVASVLCHQLATGDDLRLYVDQYGGLRAESPAQERFPRLAAEFETQRFLMFSVSDWQPHHQQILIEVAEKTADHVNLMILCDNLAQLRTTTAWLMKSSEELSHVYFSVKDIDTVWVRDFGPIFMQTSDGAAALDFFYEGTRPLDDRLPKVWSSDSKTSHVPVKWTAQGGNLLSNGDGIAITTTRIFKDNFISFPPGSSVRNAEIERRRIVVKNFVDACNLTSLVVLEPLQNEATKHVDMFASFLSPNRILVARIDPRYDPINAQILERNVMRLRNVRVDGKPLVVERIDIPPHQGESWSAYTNVVIANNLVLMPTFDRDPPAVLASAKAAYKRLLPGHHVDTINMTSMQNLQGELHCLSLHVPAFVPYLETLYTYSSARKTYFPRQLTSETTTKREAPAPKQSRSQ